MAQCSKCIRKERNDNEIASHLKRPNDVTLALRDAHSCEIGITDDLS